jgi:hypothetical protein
VHPSAEAHRRQPLHPNQAHKPVAGESLVLLPTFPGRPRRRSRRILAGRAAPTPQGLHCKQPAISRVVFVN